MTTRDFTANVISASKVVPDGNFKDSAASGVWDINEALDLIKGGNWPNAANINPAAFVDALFSTHLYVGNGGAKTITNGIDLSNKGGLVWFKPRGESGNHSLIDTARGATKYIMSNSTSAETTLAQTLDSFNSNGFTVGQYWSENTKTFASWTFRKQPKFFDVVTYTGDDSGNVVKSHSLGSTPGMIIIKNLSSNTGWDVFHRSTTNGLGTGRLFLHSTSAEDNTSIQFLTADSSSITLTHTIVKTGGENYVAYLFAHNNDDGGFGEPGDQDIIKCGSYTGAGSGSSTTVNLGFEPQFVLLKNTSSTSAWSIVDNMRGLVTGGNDQTIEANANGAEYAADLIDLTSTGFVTKSNFSNSNTSGHTFIYMAIRRGGMQTPTAASSVFGLQDYTSGGDGPVTGIVTDFSIIRDRDADAANYAATRLLGNSYLTPMLDSAEASSTDAIHDRMDGAWNTSFAGYMIWGWQRARGYFDVVAYTGTGSARTISHNLGVAPEMMWFKRRNTSDIWTVYHSALGEGKRLKLNANTAAEDDTTSFNNTAPTSSVFSIGTVNQINASGSTYVAYLFATVANVSKVGSFTQSGATNVACGFTGDTPALIILKRTDDTGNWYILDSVRGIVAGNDPHTYINESNPEISNVDLVDPYSGGFATTSSLTNGDYIFYAIAAVS